MRVIRKPLEEYAEFWEDITSNRLLSNQEKLLRARDLLRRLPKAAEKERGRLEVIIRTLREIVSKNN